MHPRNLSLLEALGSRWTASVMTRTRLAGYSALMVVLPQSPLLPVPGQAGAYCSKGTLGQGQHCS